MAATSEISHEKNLAPEEARLKFYALSDERLARSIQNEEFTTAGQRNRDLRSRVRHERSIQEDDANTAKNLVRSEEDQELAARIRQLDLQELTAAEEQDKAIAENLQRQMSTEGILTEDQKIAQEMQDAEYATYVMDKEKKRQEKQQLQQEQQRLHDEREAQRLLREEQMQRQQQHAQDEEATRSLQQQEQQGQQRQRQQDEQASQQLVQQEQMRVQMPPAGAVTSPDADQDIARRLQQQEVQQYRQALQARAAEQQRRQQLQQQQQQSQPAMVGQSFATGIPTAQVVSVPPGSRVAVNMSTGQAVTAQAYGHPHQGPTRHQSMPAQMGAAPSATSARHQPVTQSLPPTSASHQPVTQSLPPGAVAGQAQTASSPVTEEEARPAPKMGKRRILSSGGKKKK